MSKRIKKLKKNTRPSFRSNPWKNRYVNDKLAQPKSVFMEDTVYYYTFPIERISYNISRERSPIRQMGSSSPVAFAYGATNITGTISKLAITPEHDLITNIRNGHPYRIYIKETEHDVIYLDNVWINNFTISGDYLTDISFTAKALITKAKKERSKKLKIPKGFWEIV